MKRNWLIQFVLSIFFAGLVSVSATAQYGGGTNPPSVSTIRSYSNSATIAGAVGGAAAGVAITYLVLRNRGTIVGCVEPSSAGKMKLMNEKDKNTYALLASNDVTLAPGQRVALRGKKSKDSSGEPVFQVQKLAKNYGTCKQ